VAASAPPRLSASTLGTSSGPVCGSIATSGKEVRRSEMLGVTRMAPSMRVPARRARERRSHPVWSPPWVPPAQDISSYGLSRTTLHAPLRISVL